VLGEDYIEKSATLHPKSKQYVNLPGLEGINIMLMLCSEHREKARRNEFDLTTAVHQSECSNLARPPEPAHMFEVTLEPDKFTEEKFELYANYQHHVHHDPPSQISRHSFRRFLCDSPLKGPKFRIVDGVKQQLGSFHQCYRLDGRLIAISVLDLLPHCVSGVYFIYHSDFEEWSFGKISAMREAGLALEAGYQYYYMGYYIHSCPKMLYKNDYKPQTVLDLETWEWNTLDDEFKKLLNEHHYFSLSLIRKEKSGKGSEAESSPHKTFDSALAVFEAVDEGLSLFQADFVGMMSEEDLKEQVNLDKILLQIRPDLVVHAAVCLSRQSWSCIADGIIGSCAVAELDHP
jgi:arginyl-tRNA---protein transferase